MKSLFKKQAVPFVYHKYYLSAQDKWAQKMNVLAQGLSIRTLICLLVLFTVLCGSYLLYNIYKEFTKSSAQPLQNKPVISKIRTNHLKK